MNLVVWSSDLVTNVFEDFRDASDFRKRVREYWFQRLFTENPYLLGAASFELIPHPHLVPAAGDGKFPKTQIADYLLARFAFGNVADLSAIEIKRPDTPPSSLDKAVHQVEKVVGYSKDLRYAAELEQILRQQFSVGRPQVIAGHSSRPDFEQFRAKQQVTQVLAFDEVFAQQEHRFRFTPGSATGSYYDNDSFSPT